MILASERSDDCLHLVDHDEDAGVWDGRAVVEKKANAQKRGWARVEFGMASARVGIGKRYWEKAALTGRVVGEEGEGEK